MSAAEEVEAGLRGFLAQRLGDADLRIGDVRRHIEGFSWETWELTATWTRDGEPRERRLIARRVPQAGLMAPYDVPGQWELARALQSAPGVPVPAPLWIDADGAATGRPLYLMEHVAGDVPVPWSTHTYFADEAARHRVGHQLLDVLAAIGSVELETLPAGLRGRDDPDPVAEVRYWQDTYERVRREPVASLERAFGWLRVHAGDVSGHRALVHGDFRIGNAIIRGGDVVAMLDWELAHIGDPAEDVANFCLRLYRGKLKIPGGLMEIDDVLESHERATGWRVTAAALTFWLVFCDVRSAVSFLIAERLFADGQTRDLRYAAFSHQTPYLLRHVMADLPADG